MKYFSHIPCHRAWYAKTKADFFKEANGHVRKIKQQNKNHNHYRCLTIIGMRTCFIVYMLPISENKIVFGIMFKL